MLKISGSKRNSGDVPKIKKSKQTNLFGAVKVINKEALHIGKDVLLTDEIYAGHVPDEMKNKLFHYNVAGYDSRTKFFTLQHMNKMMDVDGVEWIHQDGGGELMDNFNVETVVTGMKRYCTALTRIQDFERAKVTAAKQVLKDKSFGHDGVIDFSDLDDAAENSAEGWYGQEVFAVDFELSGNTGYVLTCLVFYPWLYS